LGYDDVLPYFIKSEDNRKPYLAETPYHGVRGYLAVQEAPYRTPLAAAFIEGGIELGTCSMSFLLCVKWKTFKRSLRFPCENKKDFMNLKMKNHL
jgi:hypothetical protein